MASGWSVVTLLSVMGTWLVSRFATLSRIPLMVDGVNVTGMPSSEPDSFVAYSVTPPLKASVGLTVAVVAPPSETVSVTSPSSVIESAVNSIIRTVPPPATGMSTLPRQTNPLRVAEPAVSTDDAVDATRPGGTLPFFCTASLLAALGVPLADGLALTGPAGLPEAVGPEGFTVGTGKPIVGDGRVTGKEGVGVGVDALGVGEEDGPKQMIPRMHT